MRVLMVTQVVDLNDPVLGFTHTWINVLAKPVVPGDPRFHVEPVGLIFPLVSKEDN